LLPHLLTFRTNTVGIVVTSHSLTYRAHTMAVVLAAYLRGSWHDCSPCVRLHYYQAAPNPLRQKSMSQTVALRPPPLVRLPARRIPNPFHVHRRTRTDFPCPLNRVRLRPGHFACPLRPWLTHGIVAFRPAFHINSLIAHGIEPPKIAAISLFCRGNPVDCRAEFR
jgi:hypothetical protein